MRLLLTLSVFAVKPVNAQTAPTPSVPQFAMQPVGPPFTLNTTYSLDTDTGKAVANIGYTNEYSYLEIVINNQQFDSQYGSIYYNITVNGTPYDWVNDLYPYPEQTANSDSTIINLNVQNLLGYDRAFFCGIISEYSSSSNARQHADGRRTIHFL